MHCTCANLITLITTEHLVNNNSSSPTDNICAVMDKSEDYLLVLFSIVVQQLYHSCTYNHVHTYRTVLLTGELWPGLDFVLWFFFLTRTNLFVIGWFLFLCVQKTLHTQIILLFGCQYQCIRLPAKTRQVGH